MLNPSGGQQVFPPDGSCLFFSYNCCRITFLFSELTSLVASKDFGALSIANRGVLRSWARVAKTASRSSVASRICSSRDANCLPSSSTYVIGGPDAAIRWEITASEFIERGSQIARQRIGSKHGNQSDLQSPAHIQIKLTVRGTSIYLITPRGSVLAPARR